MLAQRGTEPVSWSPSRFSVLTLKAPSIWDGFRKGLRSLRNFSPMPAALQLISPLLQLRTAKLQQVPSNSATRNTEQTQRKGPDQHLGTCGPRKRPPELPSRQSTTAPQSSTAQETHDTPGGWESTASREGPTTGLPGRAHGASPSDESPTVSRQSGCGASGLGDKTQPPQLHRDRRSWATAPSSPTSSHGRKVQGANSGGHRLCFPGRRVSKDGVHSHERDFLSSHFAPD